MKIVVKESVRTDNKFCFFCNKKICQQEAIGNDFFYLSIFKGSLENKKGLKNLSGNKILSSRVKGSSSHNMIVFLLPSFRSSHSFHAKCRVRLASSLIKRLLCRPVIPKLWTMIAFRVSNRA